MCECVCVCGFDAKENLKITVASAQPTGRKYTETFSLFILKAGLHIGLKRTDIKKNKLQLILIERTRLALPTYLGSDTHDEIVVFTEVK